MTPHRGKHYSLPFLPATPSSPSRTLGGLFELTRCPSRALDLPRASLPEPQRIMNTVCRARRGGARTLLRTTDAKLDYAFVENALVFVYPRIGWTKAPLSTPTPAYLHLGDKLEES